MYSLFFLLYKQHIFNLNINLFFLLLHIDSLPVFDEDSF